MRRTDFENAPGLLVDESGDTLDSSSSGETADSWLGDTPGTVSVSCEEGR